MSHDRLRPYVFHGASFTPPRDNHKDAYGLCLLCHHPGQRFSVNLDTGLFKCWHCKESGNTQTFLTRIHANALATTTTTDYKALAEDRPGILWTQFREASLARLNLLATETIPRWLIPIHDSHDRLVNLRVYRPSQPIFGTTGLPLQLHGVNTLSARGPIYLCEGEWDRFALQRLLKAAKVPGSVLDAPGAGVFKDEWLPYFKSRDVVICYDNDSAGQDGSDNIRQRLAHTATSIHSLRWPAETPDGFDMRDLIHRELDTLRTPPTQVWPSFLQLLVAHKAPPTVPSLSENGVPPQTAPLYKRTSFTSIIKDFSSKLYLDKSKHAAVAVIFSTVISIQLPGDPIWMFLVGPPGAGKTRFLECFRDNPWCVFRSTVHPAVLISGFQCEEDPSLIPLLQGKVLVLKDYTEIICKPLEVQEEIYGILRGAYDGHASRSFGNGMHREYPDCHFSILAGVTDVIHGDDRAALGERFLKFQLVDGTGYDPAQHIRAAISGMAKQVENEKFTRDVSNAFTDHLVNTIQAGKIPAPEDWVTNRVVALCQIISHLRTSVPRTRKDELVYRPTPEIGTRLAKQLIKQAQTLAIVYGQPRITKEILRVVEHTAFDTARGWGLDIVAYLAQRGTATLKEEIEVNARIPSTTCQRKLENMLTVGTVRRSRVTGQGKGQPPFGWTLSPELAELWHQAKIGE